jgi:DNA-binding GntR family transcriptional regulator
VRQLDPDDPRALYVQVADRIRGAIADGEFPPGAGLPSRARLAKHFGVAPMTVQNALRVLGDEGGVVSRQGSGVYVRQVPLRDLLTEIDDLRQRIDRLEQHIDRLEQHIGRDLA